MAESGFSIKLQANDAAPGVAPTLMKLKNTTPFEKIRNAYAKKRGVDPASLKLIYDGIVITDMTKTPKDLEMEDGAMVEAMLDQVAGGPGVALL